MRVETRAKSKTDTIFKNNDKKIKKIPNFASKPRLNFNLYST